MKQVRTKEFNYNLNQTSQNFDNPQSSDDSSDAKHLVQRKVEVDFWAAGFNYEDPILIDSSLFHTWFKVYKNPDDASMLIYNEGVLVPSGKEFLYNNNNDTEPKYLTFDISTDAPYFDASVEFLSDNESGYWIGPAQVNLFDNNTDIWRPKDPTIAIPTQGTEMMWNNTVGIQRDVVIKDETGKDVSVFSLLYSSPSKVHVLVYPRDFTGTKIRRARINFEAYDWFIDNFIIYDSSVPDEQRLHKNKVNSFITITQAGKPIIINVVSDNSFNKNDNSYFQDSNGESISMTGNSFDINSLYPSYMVGDIPYQYIGMSCITNSEIKDVIIVDEGRKPVSTDIAGIYNTSDDHEFDGFIPSGSSVESKFYAKIKKYQIENSESGDETLNMPLVYIIQIILNDGNNTTYEIKINQYGYIANENLRAYDIYTSDNGQVLTDLEKEHSTPENKLKTSGSFLEDGYIFPVYFSEK